MVWYTNHRSSSGENLEIHPIAMSRSPISPVKGNITHSTPPQVGRLPTDESMSASRRKEFSLNESSPASTYGDTAASSSPVTPMETPEHGKCPLLLPSFPSPSPPWPFCTATFLRLFCIHACTSALFAVYQSTWEHSAGAFSQTLSLIFFLFENVQKLFQKDRSRIFGPLTLPCKSFPEGNLGPATGGQSIRTMLILFRLNFKHNPLHARCTAWSFCQVNLWVSHVYIWCQVSFSVG